MQITTFDASGRIRQQMVVSNEAEAIANTPDGGGFVLGRHDGRKFFIYQGEVTAFPKKAGPWAVFDFGNGQWIDPRTEADLAAEIEAQWSALRIERDRLLTACDWTRMDDNSLTESQREAWRIYRQALRDLPELTADPAAPDWPTPPAE